MLYTTCMSKKTLWTVSILVLTSAYAIVRYNVIKGTPWVDLPLFVTNKIVSLAAVAFIVLSYAFGQLAHYFPKYFGDTLAFRKFFGLFGFGLAAVHALMSLLIFTPEYYGKFFDAAGKLNLTGELSMLFGVLAFALFTMVAITSLPTMMESLGKETWLKVQRSGYWGMVLIFLHVLTMGMEGWIHPAGWPGGLLPISLVAAIIIAAGLLLKVFAHLFNKPQ